MSLTAAPRAAIEPASRLRAGEEFLKASAGLLEARFRHRPHLRAKLVPLAPTLAHGPIPIA
jgi:hypothetical protein